MRKRRKKREISYEKYVEWKLNYEMNRGISDEWDKKIKLSDIDSFRNHPFLVNNDDSSKSLVESIKENGLLNPLIVRKKVMIDMKWFQDIEEN